jgi:CBS domain-containing protein
MSQHEVGSVVVVDDDRPIGVLTDRKIALSLETTPDIGDKTASELLTGGEVVTATMDTNVFDALGHLKDAGVRRLPIVDENGRLEGIVTLDDILALLGAEINNAADVIRQQSPRF